MTCKKYKTIYIIALVACMLPSVVHGQRILRVTVDSAACLADSVKVGMGYMWNHEVVVMNYQTTLNYADPAFLPDGVECGEMGCSYRSPVTFEDFSPSTVIRNANDINYIRVKLEHSYIGDIYINITCPNGQKASLMNFGGSGTSSCNSTIPSQHRGWATGSNANLGTHFGIPVDQENSMRPCDSNAYGNQSGVGWNYCWSSNTRNGYQYAPGDGIIYRSTNTTSTTEGNAIDSSNVANGTNFYHPEQNLASLVGCPVNGDWYIEVMDGWTYDNGYIFEWELSLNSDLVGEQGGLVSAYELTGDSVHRINDSTFMVYPPAGATSDTTVTYTARVYDNVGNWVDTTFSIQFVDMMRESVTGEYCMGDTVVVDELTLTESTQRVDLLVIPGQLCPTERTIDLVFHPSYLIYDTLRACPNESHTYAGMSYPVDGDYTLRNTTVRGCDSITRLAVRTIDPGFSAMVLLTDDTTAGWFHDTLLAGCVPYTVHMADTQALTASCRWHTGDTGWYAGTPVTHTYDSAGTYSITLAATSPNGCRDTAVVHKAVYVFERPEPDFWWEPESPVMSHPDVEIFAQEGEGRLGYTWAVQRGDGGGYDTLYGSAVSYTWRTEDDLAMGDMSVTLIEVRHHTGPYGLPLDCYDSVTKTVTIVNDWLQFPNLVTPNGDGINDIWKVVNLLECGMYSMNELWVYSAWGSLVYHAKNIAKEEDFWDPDDTNSPDGTYYFRFSARSLYGIVKRNGMIEVVR